jgi:hypothetical protein
VSRSNFEYSKEIEFCSEYKIQITTSYSRKKAEDGQYSWRVQFINGLDKISDRIWKKRSKNSVIGGAN